MDESVIKFLEQPKVGTLKLSEAIREGGYGDRVMSSYEDCVIGRAYHRLTGKRLIDEARRDAVPADEMWAFYNSYTAKAFGVPFKVCLKAEQMCYAHEHSKEQIADYVASQGY